MAFMTHPKHGATITNDVAEHEKNGWSISAPEAWIAGKNSGSAGEESPTELVSDDFPKVQPEEAPKKRGRPAAVK